MEKLRRSFEHKLSDSNRGVVRVSDVSMSLDVLNIKWAINDNLTDEMFKGGAMLDIADILKVINGSGVDYYLVNLEGTFALIDKLGNTSEETVIWATYPVETVSKINWDNFLFKDVYNIASTHKFHPAFEQDAQ
jgi:hypothetical protein